MKTLNLLLIVLLVVFLAMGCYTIYHVYKFYNSEFIPHKILVNHVYPFELFEVICLSATIYCLVKFVKGDYVKGVYVGFALVLLSSLFFSFI